MKGDTFRRCPKESALPYYLRKALNTFFYLTKLILQLMHTSLPKLIQKIPASLLIY